MIGIRDDPLQRIVDGDGHVVPPAAFGRGAVEALADGSASARAARDLEVLEGARRADRRRSPASSKTCSGCRSTWRWRRCIALMREGDVASGALLQVDRVAGAAVGGELKAMPGVAGAGFKRAVLRKLPRNDGRQHGHDDLHQRGVRRPSSPWAWSTTRPASRCRSAATSWPACACSATPARKSPDAVGRDGGADAGGVAARLAVRLRRSRWRIVQTVQSEVYRFPLYISRAGVAWASLGIIAAAVGAGLIVRRRLDRLDLIAVLKVRE